MAKCQNNQSSRKRGIRLITGTPFVRIVFKIGLRNGDLIIRDFLFQVDGKIITEEGNHPFHPFKSEEF